MPHPSEADPEVHTTVLMQDSQGDEVSTGHVTSDSSKQQVVRLLSAAISAERVG